MTAVTTTDWLTPLRAALPEGAVVVDPDVVVAHARDQAQLAPAGEAACLVRAGSRDDVVIVLAVAAEHGVPVVTRGAGTGLAGAANAVDGCIVLSLERLDRIVAVDPGTRTAVVEPGVLNAALAAAAAEHGLTYAPDPASRAISTIGGNIATDAGGACCLKYGVTGDHVAALVAVLPGGTVIRTGSITGKDVAGLDLTRLLTGSEGTLAVIVEATMRLRPLPAGSATLAAFFDSTEDAGRAVVDLQARLDPSLVELIDRTTLRAIEAHTRMDLDTEAGALLVVQSDTVRAGQDIAEGAALCEAAGATMVVQTDDPEEGEALLQARRLAYPALERLGTTLLDDVAVPRPAIPALLSAVTEIADRHGLVIGTFGHAGDGNFHPTIVEERALMHRIKAAFDPTGILNPGKAY